MKKQLLLAAISLLPWCSATAQDNVQGTRPRVILVQLPTEENRMKVLDRRGHENEVLEITHDAQEVRNVMVKDFTDHFTFCPVYYFMDNNLERVKAQDFNGVLLGKDMQPVNNLEVGPGSKDYLVVRYDRPEGQPKREKVVKQTAGIDEGPMARGLVVSNYKLQQVKAITVNDQKKSLMTPTQRKLYSYRSKHYMIEYYPLAKELDNKVPRIYE
jgi:hypothetical protein